jgi:hypothetical protein
VAGASIIEDSSLQGIDVILVTGADFDGILAEPRPVSATTVPPPPVATTVAPAAPDC